MANMVGNVASGMASGVGFGVAQRAVDAVMGPRSMEVVHTNSAAPVTAAQPQMMQQNLQQNPCAAYQEELSQVGKSGCLNGPIPFSEELRLCTRRHILASFRHC